MVELSRTVRFCLSDSGGRGSADADAPLASSRHNTYSAWPAMRGLGRYYALHVRCRGEADPVTGYFINIKHIDEAVREQVLPDLETWSASGSMSTTDHTPMGELMRRIFSLLEASLGAALTDVALQLTPMVRLTIRSPDMDRVMIRQQYEFSAAHRLHVPSMSDEENRATFGKCNNPAGHGHNYRVETAVWTPIDPQGHVLTIQELDETVDQHVIQKLDHKHLNIDVPEFHDVNPSVEHIAQAIWRMLEKPLKNIGPVEGTRLDEVSVWETEKTVCTYRGEGRGDEG